MNKDTQNVVLVFLCIIIVLIVTLGGGFWYFNHGETLFESNSHNKTIIPNKYVKDDGEYALTLDDENVKILIKDLKNYKDKQLLSQNSLFKIAYARKVIENKKENINIYDYFIYKDNLLNTDSNVVSYRYYSDIEKNNLIIETEQDIDNSIFNDYESKAGMYKYSFTKNEFGNYAFVEVEKVR